MNTRPLAVAGVVVLAAGTLSADTLVMRDGRRLNGQVIAMRDGLIDFDQQRGFFGHERIRVDRLDVRSIEFDDVARSDFDRGDRDRDRDRDDAPGPSRPPGMRERDVSVDAATAWNDTGIDVGAGQTVYFSAGGRVRWGPGRQDGPAGEDNSPRNDRRPIPGRPAAALIGRIGDSAEYFFIGDEKGPMRMRSSGRLYLGINDDYLKDNSGAFRVTVYW